MAVNDVAVLSLIWQNAASGAQARNVLKYQMTAQTGEDEAAWTAIAVAVAAAIWPDAVKAFYAATTILERIDWYGVSQPTQEGTAPITEAGVATGEALPLLTAPLVQKKTGLRGKRFNGRMFMPAPIEAVQNAGLLTTPYREAVDTALEAAREVTGSDRSEARMILASIDYDDTPPTINFLTPVTSVNVRTRVSSIGPRQPGRSRKRRRPSTPTT